MVENISKLILASASPRRRQLMADADLKFTVLPSHVSETTKETNPSKIVRELALRKAIATAKKIKTGLVIGSDTIVVLKGEIIGKPENHEHAAQILGKLNGTWHKVYTGVAVVNAASGNKQVASEMSRVKMRKLDAEEVRRFSRKHLDKAGAYAVQETGDRFVEKIVGDYTNVVGLPVSALLRLLRLVGYKQKPHNR
jgi:septum formation protein